MRTAVILRIRDTVILRAEAGKIPAYRRPGSIAKAKRDYRRSRPMARPQVRYDPPRATLHRRSNGPRRSVRAKPIAPVFRRKGRSIRATGRQLDDRPDRGNPEVDILAKLLCTHCK